MEHPANADMLVMHAAGRRSDAGQRRKRDGLWEDGRQARPRHAAAERAAPPGEVLVLSRRADRHPQQHQVLRNLSVLRHRAIILPNPFLVV